MRKITRTIHGARLQTAMLLGLPYSHIPNTTLNEKFEVQAGTRPTNNTLPTVRYFAVGIGGRRFQPGAEGLLYSDTYDKSARYGALFRHMPFLLRDPSDDLDNVTRQRYAMRKLINHGGRQYVAYYLKKLNLEGVQAQMMLNTVSEGVTTSVPYVPASADLNPVPREIPNAGVVSTTGDYLSVSAVSPLNFSAQDVAELLEVSKILFGKEQYAVISEIGLVAGVEQMVSGPGPGNTSITYNEALMAQIVTHISAEYSVAYSNDGFDFGLELGAVEPLLGITTGT